MDASIIEQISAKDGIKIGYAAAEDSIAEIIQ
jgi:hypothetical protein